MVLGSRMGPREFRRHPSLSNLRRVPGWPSHDPILSRNWVSEKPGTVHHEPMWYRKTNARVSGKPLHGPCTDGYHA